MKKLLNLFILITLVSFSLSCKKETIIKEVVQPSLLINSNIESGLQSWYPGYSGYDNPNLTNPNGFTLELSEEFASSPKNSLKISCSKISKNTAFCFFSQSIPTKNLKTGAKLTLKAKIKALNLVGPGLSIAIRGDKAGQTSSVFFQTTQGTTPITGNFDFKEFSVSLDSYAGNADNIIIFLVFLPDTTGTAYIDDITLVSN